MDFEFDLYTKNRFSDFVAAGAYTVHHSPASVGHVIVLDTVLRGMGRHSWKCSRFKRTQMKIIHKYNLFHNFDFICFPYK